MSLWVVVGGQYGSEGKGKISAFLTAQEQIDICIRCGGPNSGHSFVAPNGETIVLRQLPTGYIREQTRLLIPAGALVDLDVLRHEIESLRLDPARVGIDRNAMIVEPADREREAAAGLRERLSSTLCGVGSAVARRALRGADVTLAGQSTVDWLRPFVTDASGEANSALDAGRKVLVEGTQGFGLSLYHSVEYPKATSRDTTAAGFISEVGLSPRLVDEIVVVFRTFPIRVAGAQAGTLRNEISWDILQKESGCPYPIHEVTSVTRKTRRVGRFDWDLACAAVRTNRPTKLAICGLDYFDYRNKGVTAADQLSPEAAGFLNDVQCRLNVEIGFWSAGPGLADCSVEQISYQPVAL